VPLAAERFRELFGAVPTAVAVVTSATAAGPHGTTVSAFGAVSLEPPLVQVSLDRESNLLAAIELGGHFAINVLGREQDDLAHRFARTGRDEFDGVTWTLRDGSPWIDGCHGWISASVEDVIVAGDHSIVLGLAQSSEVRAGVPLLYHSRTFHFPTPLPEFPAG
jgi:flavin reductase (DIM6/NTAB) family NADH-FMN oxidoreductase RutF